MVSNWMESGTINRFVETERDVNRIDLVGCFSILVPQKLTRFQLSSLMSWMV